MSSLHRLALAGPMLWAWAQSGCVCGTAARRAGRLVGQAIRGYEPARGVAFSTCTLPVIRHVDSLLYPVWCWA